MFGVLEEPGSHVTGGQRQVGEEGGSQAESWPQVGLSQLICCKSGGRWNVREPIMPAGRFGGGRLRKFSPEFAVISV